MKEYITRFKYVILAFLIVLGTLFFYYYQVSTAKITTDDVIYPYMQADSLINNAISGYAAQDKNKVLYEQNEIITNKKAHHFRIVRMMNAYYFATTLTLTVISVLTGLMLFSVAGTGIKEKSATFKTVFFTLIGLAAFLGLLIEVLDQKENINTNKKKYLEYSAVQIKLYNYIVTGEDDTKKMKEFISEINQDINRINDISFGIKHEEIGETDKIFNESMKNSM